MSALVIGYGNPLRGDDGAGAAVAEAVRRARRGVQVMTPQQLVPELADRVAESDVVVFVDAAADVPAGGVDCARVCAAERPAIDHAMSPATLLALTDAVYGTAPPAWVVRVGGQRFEVGVELSAAVRGAIACATAVVLETVGAARKGSDPGV